ncbi:ubiquitin E3 ligase ICP0 [Burkholderia multivorans CGD1]|nr:ubiquitin E3 ligase ICP0 [Burkholderia multivorans CGD1]
MAFFLCGACGVRPCVARLCKPCLHLWMHASVCPVPRPRARAIAQSHNRTIAQSHADARSSHHPK